MKFFRFGAPGAERPGAIDSNGVERDISALVGDLAGEALDPARLAALAARDLSGCPVVPVGRRIGPCVGRIGNFIGVGLNYADHAIEAGHQIPVEPLLFNKAPTCVAGPNDDLRLPPGSVKTDWEVELAVVIGRPALYLSEAEVPGVIAGYCLCNDVSERAYQNERGGQFTKGKGCPGFGPLGPWLVTPDEIADVQDLRLRLLVNGETMQDGHSAEMLFGVHHLVAYISQFMALAPGDVITTGTPAGVGLGRTPQRFLRAGDVVEAEVQGLGRQRQQVVA